MDLYRQNGCGTVVFQFNKPHTVYTEHPPAYVHRSYSEAWLRQPPVGQSN